MKTLKNNLSTTVHKFTRVFVTNGSHKVLIGAGQIEQYLSKEPKGLITHVFVADIYNNGKDLSGIYPIENIFYCEMGI